MVQNYSEKATSPINKKQKQKKKKKHVWLSGRLHIGGRLNEGPRLKRKHKDEYEAKQNKRNARQRRHDIQTKRREPARARLLWAILSLIPPVTFGHTTACRSSALAFSATTHFAMKCSAACSAILRHSPSSWAAVVYWSALTGRPRWTGRHCG